MIIDKFNTDKNILIIAEIGNNHEGNFSLAEEMVYLASRSGVDAVKFQTFITEKYTTRRDEARFNRLKSFELTFDEFEKLSKTARKLGLIFLSTPLDLESAKFLNNIVPAFKIASGDNNFYPLLEETAKTGKPIILSSGLTTLEQIKYSKEFIEKIWNKNNIKQELAVLHCVSSYPAPPGEINLNVIPKLKKELNCVIGYSDHAMGISAAVISAALGARIIEKHFTKDKNYSDFRDHKLSADPWELAALVKGIREAEILLGSDKKDLQKSEQSSLAMIRRSIVAVRDLPAGSFLGKDDITWMRPYGGLPPGDEHLVIGKKLLKKLHKDDQITLDVLCEDK